MYSIDYLQHFTHELFKTMGCPQEDASTLADVLLAAEKRGISSHGLIRVKDYYQMWQKGRINLHPRVSIIRETPGTATVDGDGAFGMVAARRSMEIAIEKAGQEIGRAHV